MSGKDRMFMSFLLTSWPSNRMSAMKMWKHCETRVKAQNISKYDEMILNDIEGWPFVSLLALWFKCLLNRKGMFRRCLGPFQTCNIEKSTHESVKTTATQANVSCWLVRWIRITIIWIQQTTPQWWYQLISMCESEKTMKQYSQNNVFCATVWDPSKAVGAKAWSFGWQRQL